MSFRLAAYAVCIEGGRVLLAHHASNNWTLPGGRVEHAEDPFDTVVREVAEETGCSAVVERLLGVDSTGDPRGRRACGNRAPECRCLLPGPCHWRPAPDGAERRNRRVGLDSDSRCRLSAPVIAGRCRPRPGSDASGDRPRRCHSGQRPDPALRRAGCSAGGAVRQWIGRQARDVPSLE